MSSREADSLVESMVPATDSLLARPFVKWVGGKRSILNELTKRLPSAADFYYEPFVGGGALFFALQPERASLSDINFHLMCTYQAIKENVEAVIEEVTRHARCHNKKYYASARKHLSIQEDRIRIAGLFIYLNKTCYNGMYRVNKAGEFNVPLGSPKNETSILDADNLRHVSHALQSVEIQHRYFEHTPLRRNAFYYLDPPYHKTYDSYHDSGFGDAKHRALADLCCSIDRAGGGFMLSNSDTPFIRGLYGKFKIEEVLAKRSVSCKAVSRGKESELIIRNYS